MDYSFICNDQDTSFSTPLPRSDIPRNNRLFYHESEKEWTAARCQRLLRTLTSRVAILRKEICRYGKLQPPEFENRCFSPSFDTTSSCRNNSIDWTGKKTKLKRTYGRLRKTQQPCIGSMQTPRLSSGKKLLLPGEFTIPTPVLARVRDEKYIERSPSGTITSSKTRDQSWNARRRSRSCVPREQKQPQFFGSLHDLRHSMSAAQYNTYDGIYNGLEILLHTTSEIQAPIKIKGTRSLLETALRAVPRYIIDQQTLLQIHLHETGSKSAIEDRDISREIYDDLESFGSCENGWKRLKDVVRAHGVMVISEAIEEGLLTFEFCRTLISLCIHIGATEEAQLILSSTLSSSTYSPPRSPNDSMCKPICLLQKFTKYTNQTTFFYRELSSLIKRGILPFEWLASKELGQAWTGLMQSLLPESLEYEASIFLDTTLSWFLKNSYQSQSCKNVRNLKSKHDCLSDEIIDALKNTFSSVLTILLSIILLVRNSQYDSSATKNPPTGRFDYIVYFLGGLLDYLPANHLENEHHILLLISNIIIHEEHTKLKSKRSILNNLPGRLTSIKDKNTKLSKIVNFVCQIARCCGRGTSGLGFDYLKLIHLRLRALDSERDVTSFLKGIIVDSASLFARKVPHYQHVEYAASMDATYFTRTNSAVNSQVSLSENTVDENVSGFRWEEGIGEWVTTTPATSKLKRKAIQISEDTVGSNLSPIPSKVRRRVVSSVSVVIQSSFCHDNAQKINNAGKKRPNSFNLSAKKLPEDQTLSVSADLSQDENKHWNRLRPQTCVRNGLLPRQDLLDRNQIKNSAFIDSQQQQLGEFSEGSRETYKNIKCDTKRPECGGSKLSSNLDIRIDGTAYQSIHVPMELQPRLIPRKSVADFPFLSSGFLASVKPPDHRVGASNHVDDSNHTWKVFPLGDDEDELSYLSFTSSTATSPTQKKKREARDRNARVKPDLHYETLYTKRHSIRRARPNRNIEIRIENMKKCILSRRRTRSSCSGHDKEWSEDELCS